MSNETMARQPVDEAAFSADEMGRANYLASKPRHRIVNLNDYPRIAAYFGLGTFEKDRDGEVVLVSPRRDKKTGVYAAPAAGEFFVDDTGRPHVVGVITTVTYRELIEKP